jgi:hypothetical protein
MLAPDTPMDIVRAALCAAGIDPAEVQGDADALLNEVQGRGGAATGPNNRTTSGVSGRRYWPAALRLRRMTKEQLVEHVNALRSNPATAVRVAQQLQRPVAEDATEEELRAILEEFEVMFASDDVPDPE